MSLKTLFSPQLLKKILLGSLFEFGPIVIFLASFHYLHIYRATLVLMVVTIISTVLTYRIQKRLPYLALYVAFITIIFGYMTISLREPRFIQMRDTLYDITFALTLIGGLIANVSFLKFAFNSVLPATDRAWTRFTYAWIFFFVVNAILNEYVRRTMSLHDWFDFKSTMVIVTLIFGITTLVLFYEKPHLPQKES